MHIYELMTVGYDYVSAILAAKTDLHKDYDKYVEIKKRIYQIKHSFTESELEYIEHARHCSCHIFQNGYEKSIKKDGTIKSKRNNKEINKIKEEISSVFWKESDIALNFNENFNKTVIQF